MSILPRLVGALLTALVGLTVVTTIRESSTPLTGMIGPSVCYAPTTGGTCPAGWTPIGSPPMGCYAPTGTNCAASFPGACGVGTCAAGACIGIDICTPDETCTGGVCVRCSSNSDCASLPPSSCMQSLCMNPGTAMSYCTPMPLCAPGQTCTAGICSGTSGGVGGIFGIGGIGGIGGVGGGSAGSTASTGSAGSTMSVGSTASIASRTSTSSVRSTASAGSTASTGSRASVASAGSAGSVSSGGGDGTGGGEGGSGAGGDDGSSGGDGDDPPLSEICTDNADNDGDSLADCADADCAGAVCSTLDVPGKSTSWCTSPAPGTCRRMELDCTDVIGGSGVDNDGDGLANCADSDCSSISGCPDCGNGTTEAPEQCDDGISGNADIPNRNCRSDCRLARCGDNIADTAPAGGRTAEQCDTGSSNNDATPNACRTNCRLPRCGDNVIDNSYGEICDNGPANSDTVPNACRRNCAPARCRDGVKDAGEECDDGNSINNDSCRNDCKIPACGNGVIDAGEACDIGKHCSNGLTCTSDADCPAGKGPCITRNFGCKSDCTALRCTVAQGYPGYAPLPVPAPPEDCDAIQNFMDTLEDRCNDDTCGGAGCVPKPSGRSIRCDDDSDPDSTPDNGSITEQYYYCPTTYGICPHPPTDLRWLCQSPIYLALRLCAPAGGGGGRGAVRAPDAAPLLENRAPDPEFSPTIAPSTSSREAPTFLEYLQSFFGPRQDDLCGDSPRWTCFSGTAQCCKTGEWRCPDFRGNSTCPEDVTPVTTTTRITPPPSPPVVPQCLGTECRIGGNYLCARALGSNGKPQVCSQLPTAPCMRCEDDLSAASSSVAFSPPIVVSTSSAPTCPIDACTTYEGSKTCGDRGLRCVQTGVPFCFRCAQIPIPAPELTDGESAAASSVSSSTAVVSSVSIEQAARSSVSVAASETVRIDAPPPLAETPSASVLSRIVEFFLSIFGAD